MTKKEQQMKAQLIAMRHAEKTGYTVIVIEPRQGNEEEREYVARMCTAEQLCDSFKMPFVLSDRERDMKRFGMKGEAIYMGDEVGKEVSEYLNKISWKEVVLVCRTDRVRQNALDFIDHELFPTIMAVNTGSLDYDYVGEESDAV